MTKPLEDLQELNQQVSEVDAKLLINLTVYSKLR